MGRVVDCLAPVPERFWWENWANLTLSANFRRNCRKIVHRQLDTDDTVNKMPIVIGLQRLVGVYGSKNDLRGPPFWVSGGANNSNFPMRASGRFL